MSTLVGRFVGDSVVSFTGRGLGPGVGREVGGRVCAAKGMRVGRELGGGGVADGDTVGETIGRNGVNNSSDKVAGAAAVTSLVVFAGSVVILCGECKISVSVPSTASSA